MSETEFREGDAAQHKSGGPKMIYTGKIQTGDAICERFDGKGRKQDSFSFHAITKYVAPRAMVSRLGRA